MMQLHQISIGRILGRISTALLLASCWATPMAEPPPPTPSPMPAGHIFWEPSRVLTETRAIEVVISDLTKSGVPVEKHRIVITNSTTLHEITTTLLTATSQRCATALPTPRPERGYGIALYLYSRSEILPSDPARSQWMIASVHYYQEENLVGIDRPGSERMEFCPVGTTLREILARELSRQGVAWPHGCRPL